VNCDCKLLHGRRVEGLPDGLRPRIFAGLSDPDLAGILARARHQRFAASSIVLHEGDPAESIFLLTRGQGAHFVVTDEGRKILLYWLTAGQIFGGAALLSPPCPYLASTEVDTDSCALVWSRRDIREIAAEHSVLLDNALSIAATEHFAWQLASRISMATEEAPVRVARLLVSLACGIGRSKPDGVEILVANEDLASATGVTPFTVSRLIAEWQRAGIIRKGRGRIVLRRPELLALRTHPPSKSPIDERRSVA
jgi:CRP-like cAMP-binding protein